MRTFLLTMLVALQAGAAVRFGAPRPVSGIDSVFAGGNTEIPFVVANGDRALVLWGWGEGAARIDADGKPLDVPAIRLPRPAEAWGAHLAPEGDGWVVAWTRYQSLRLVHVSRDGVVGAPRDLPFPEAVSGSAFRFARGSARMGMIALTNANGDPLVGVVSLGDAAPAVVATVEGVARALTPTASGYALLLADRLVRLGADGVPVAAIALPQFAADDAVAIGDDVYVAGRSGNSFAPAVLRIAGGSNEVTPLAQFASGSYEVRIERDGGALLLSWITHAGYDLAIARLGTDGSITGPHELPRDAMSTRWGPGLVLAGTACFGGRCTLVWSEGFVTPSVIWRDVYTAGIDAAVHIAPPQIVAWRASDQQLIGSATAAGVVLVVWHDPWGSQRSADGRMPVFAARFTPEGEPLDAAPMHLGALEAYAVHATRDGFVVFGSRGQVRMRLDGSRVSDPPAPRVSDFACNARECAAVWIERTAAGESLRLSRWAEGTLLDAPGVLVHASAQPYSGVALAASDDGFLLAFGRFVAPGVGSIHSAARLRSGAGGGWDIRLSDFAASPEAAFGMHLVREGDRYLAAWHQGGSVRASRLTLEGHSLDGAETGWEGWRIEGLESLADLAYDGERTLLLAENSNTLRQLRGRTAVPVGSVTGTPRKIECAAPGRCLLISQQDLTGGPWYQATRLFLQTFAFVPRRAAVRR